MGNLGFYFDSTKCIGCRACQIACKDRHSLMEPGITIRTVESFETGTFPEAYVYSIAKTCNHCESPLCVANCPQGAMYKAEDGTVQHKDELCIGCGMCVASCPYGVPKLLEDQGKAIKCDACIAFRQNGKNPVCVDACVMRALDFGDLDELRAKYGNDLVSAIPAMSDGGTNPNTLIKPKACVMEPVFRRVVL